MDAAMDAMMDAIMMDDMVDEIMMNTMIDAVAVTFLWSSFPLP